MKEKKKLPLASDLHMFIWTTIAGLKMNPNPYYKELAVEIEKIYFDRFKQPL